MTSLAESRVAIVGIGLIGGSLALALKGKCMATTGVDLDPSAVELARATGAVDFATADVAAGVRDCNLIVLATPVRSIIALLAKIPSLISSLGPHAQAANPPISILDVGSTKTAVLAAMEALPSHFDPVGGHPMCGREVAGLAHADPDLFRGQTFVLTPLPRTTPPTLGLARELVSATGAKTLELSALAHDTLTALISHLPYVAAVALVRAVESVRDDRAWALAASGFRDASRLAASDLTMMIDILISNRPAILDALVCYRRELDMIAGWIDTADSAILHEALHPTQVKRAELAVGSTNDFPHS